MDKKRTKIVIKIGTNVLTTPAGQLDLNSLRNIAYQVSDIVNSSLFDVILVSSGAIICGAEKAQLDTSTIPGKQAAAAVGQILLYKEYDLFFGHKGLPIAQLLLTKEGLSSPQKQPHILNTLHELLSQHIVPIINENDSVCIEEIDENFGDNDLLACEVTKIWGADQLIILTDIDGLYNKNPAHHDSGTLISTVHSITDELLYLAEGPRSSKSRGGMHAKLCAAKELLRHQITTIIANGRRANIIHDILKDDFVGTSVSPST